MKKLIASLSVVSALIFSSTASADVAVVVNPGAADSLDSKTISRMFLGKAKSFDSGVKVTPLYQNTGSAMRAEFNDKVLGRSDSQLKAYWSKLMFTGKGSMPKELADDAAVIAAVASTPGAIGYVDAASVDGSVTVVATF